ncbi:uncharacterized protein SCHCODRAFT_02670552 [Schizophyllum commune H4-8]|uniref:uncharacterized protein n=1 Tax=Schizophyllum commune (strain H4-8 / FGSC 9210) TaxID=578458 RepID=UPI00215E9B3E|nr:uncharacterized protein SCHCODRAFT_02670552 [Schizophyllum commune H4-8]KAI5889574.1 hypothetical protein SCHCODRAFT_02670552 [Schizophyllum commune H4-8]
MERQKKRRRDADCPIVTYRVGHRTFERLLKEDSLEETKEAIRQKFKVEDGVQVQLAQLRDGMTIDLEDEDDFDAFHTAAHKTSGATVKVTVIRANGVPASHISIAPTDSISNAVATSSRSVHFSSPEDELPHTGGKRKASAIELASEGESASIPRRHRPVKRRRDEAPEEATDTPAEQQHPEEPVQEDEEPEPAPVVVKKKRGRPPKVKPLEGVQTSAGTSPSAGASASAGAAPAETAPEPPAPNAMDTAPDSVTPAPLPEKKKRGRPRKDSMSASAQPASSASQVAAQPTSTAAAPTSQPAANGDAAPPVPVKRKPGRPRKHPLPEGTAQAAAQSSTPKATAPQQTAEVVIEQASASRGRSTSRRPTDPDNDVGDANAAQEEASKKKRTRSRSRSRAPEEGKASKLKAALAQDDAAHDDGTHDAHVHAEPSADTETPSTAKRGRKKKVVPPSGEDADNEDASPEVENAPKERKKKKKVVQEAVGR